MEVGEFYFLFFCSFVDITFKNPHCQVFVNLFMKQSIRAVVSKGDGPQ